MSAEAAPPVHVFLVDDEPGVTDALMGSLQSVRIESSAHASPSAFLEAIRRFDGAARAVVDLRMPETSGLELQQRLLEAGCQLPLVFLTAHGDVPDSSAELVRRIGRHLSDDLPKR